MSTQFNFGSLPTINTTTANNAFSFGGQTTNPSSLGGMPSVPSLSTTTTPFSLSTTQSSFMNAMNPLQTTISGTGFPPNPTLTLTLTTASTAVTQTSSQQTNAFHGLGGTQTTSIDGRSDETSIAKKSNKELTSIPPEIIPLVESFKNFVKEQKLIREENSQQRFSIQPILEVGSELEDNLKINLQKIEIEIQRNSKAMEALKRETNKLLSNAEMAFRISRVDLLQTPSSYTIAQNKYINASTHQYFIEIINNFETQMNNYSKQIKDLETHIENMNKPYSTEELLQIMRKQHETLISLAAKVYAIHDDIHQMQLKLQTQTNYTSSLVENTSQPKTDTTSSNRQSFVGPNPFSLTGDESSFDSPLYPILPLNTQSSIGLGNTSLSTANVPTVQPMTTISSTFQFTPAITTSSTSHSRAKRYTTS